MARCAAPVSDEASDPIRALPECADRLRSFDSTRRLGPRETTDVAVGDVDADGQIDAFFSNQLEESLTVYWGNGRGLLEDPVEIAAGRVGTAVALGDLNGDGHKEIVVANQDDARLRILPGLGDRRFGNPVDVWQSELPQRPRVLDWDGDGEADLMFELFTCTAWRKGDGKFGFAGHQCLTPVFASGVKRTKSDILAVTAGPKGGRILYADEDGWQWVEADGRGLLGAREPVVSKELAARLSSGGFADVDGDGQGEVYGWEQPFEGALVRFTKEGGAWHGCRVGDDLELALGVVAGDLDGDRKLDVLTCDSCTQCTSNHIVSRGM